MANMIDHRMSSGHLVLHTTGEEITSVKHSGCKMIVAGLLMPIYDLQQVHT